LTPEVIGWLPGCLMVPPLNKVVKAIFIVAIQELIEFPFLNRLRRSILPFENSSSNIARFRLIDRYLAWESCGICLGAQKVIVEHRKNSNTVRELNSARTRIHFQHIVWSSPFVVAFFHWAVCLHVSGIDVDLVSDSKLRCILAVCVGIVLIPLLRLLCQGFQQVQYPFKSVCDDVGFIELCLLRSAQIWRAR
jgi:hypothetical protein